MNLTARINKLIEQSKHINKRVRITKFRNEESLENIVKKYDDDSTLLMAIYVGEYKGVRK